MTAGTETSDRTEMLPDRRRAVLIVNTRARSGASAYEQARQLLSRGRGFTLDASFPVQDPARIPKLVTDALAEGHSFVMIGGGDGTIGAAVNVLAGKDATCGLLPLGTANSFAAASICRLIWTQLSRCWRRVGRKRSISAKSTTATLRQRSRLDFSSEIQRRKPDKIKSLLGRFAYPTIAGLVLPGFRPFTCTLTRDGGERSDFPAALEVRIANAPYEGGIDAAPDASVTSGDLVVHIVTGSSKWRLVKTWGKIVMGLDPEGPGYETFRAKHLHIATDPPQYVNVDGDAVLTDPVST